MATTLYLIETRARRTYLCPACQQSIPKGTLHFRHDPHPRARIFRGEPTTHWCRECIRGSFPDSMDGITRRLRVPAVRVMSHSSVSGDLQLPLFNPIRIELVGIGRVLSEQLRTESSQIYRITPEQFEEFLCDRLFAMGIGREVELQMFAVSANSSCLFLSGLGR
jgi:hypothetical protein